MDVVVVQPLVVDYNKNIVVTGGGNYIDGLVNSVLLWKLALR